MGLVNRVFNTTVSQEYKIVRLRALCHDQPDAVSDKSSHAADTDRSLLVVNGSKAV